MVLSMNLFFTVFWKNGWRTDRKYTWKYTWKYSQKYIDRTSLREEETKMKTERIKMLQSYQEKKL